MTGVSPEGALNEVLPEYDFNEQHSIGIAAPAEAALAAARAVTAGEMPLTRFLFAIRSLPARLTRGRGLPADKDRPLLEQMVEFGFVPLGEIADEIVVGYVGQPWKLAGGSAPRFPTAEEWLAFAEPGYAKAAMNFRAADGVLETETRIQATDPVSRRNFGRYWRVIQPGSGLIRRSWLRAAKKRAERP